MTQPYKPLSPEELSALMKARPKPQNAITQQDLIDRVAKVNFSLIKDANGSVRKTVCDIELDNGWNESGESVVVDPANFNSQLGQHFAFMDAIGKLWRPVAFAKREVEFLKDGQPQVNTILIIDSLGEDDLKFYVVDSVDLSYLDGVYINMEGPEDLDPDVWANRQNDVWELVSHPEKEGYFRDDLLDKFPVDQVTSATVVVKVGMVP